MSPLLLALAMGCAHPGRAPVASAPGIDAIYLVMVDRFDNGNPGNDADADPSDKTAFHGGDLAGVAARLDHIEALGFDTVWLTPIAVMQTENIGEHGAFHGYWPTGEAAVEPRFGTLTELRALRDALADRDMGLLLDAVLNHVAPSSALRDAHPDWFHGHGDITDWADPSQLQTHDVHGLPDLAQEEPAVSDWLTSAGIWWMRSVDPLGIRLDAVRHMPAEFLAHYAEEIRAIGGPDTVVLGEIYDGNPVTVASGARAAGLSHVFDFPLHHALVEGMCEDGDLRRIASVLTLDAGYPNPHHLVTFLDNHDRPRIRSVCGEDSDKVHDAITLLTSLRGIPAFSWGTESGLSGMDETEARGDMVFGPSPTAAVLKARLAQRASSNALRRGETDVLRSAADVLAFARVSADEAIVVQVGDADPPSLPALAGEVEWRSMPSGETAVHRWHLLPADRSVGFEPWRDGLLARRVTRVPVRFTTQEGPVWIAGSDPALGGWDPEQAVGPIPAGGAVTVHLPVGGTVALKLIRRDEDGTVEWSERDDTWVVLPRTPTKVPTHALQF